MAKITPCITVFNENNCEQPPRRSFARVVWTIDTIGYRDFTRVGGARDGRKEMGRVIPRSHRFFGRSSIGAEGDNTWMVQRSFIEILCASRFVCPPGNFLERSVVAFAHQRRLNSSTRRVHTFTSACVWRWSVCSDLGHRVDRNRWTRTKWKGVEKIFFFLNLKIFRELALLAYVFFFRSKIFSDNFFQSRDADSSLESMRIWTRFVAHFYLLILRFLFYITINYAMQFSFIFLYHYIVYFL